MGAVMPTGLTEFICTQILQAKDGDCLMYEIKAADKPTFCPSAALLARNRLTGTKRDT